MAHRAWSNAEGGHHILKKSWEINALVEENFRKVKHNFASICNCFFQNMGLSVSELRNATWNVDCAHKFQKINHFSSKHNAIKNGTPMIEVMIPVGNSLGLTIILHNMSANNKIVALKIMLKGISFCDFGPTIFRAI